MRRIGRNLSTGSFTGGLAEILEKGYAISIEEREPGAARYRYPSLTGMVKWRQHCRCQGQSPACLRKRFANMRQS